MVPACESLRRRVIAAFALLLVIGSVVVTPTVGAAAPDDSTTTTSVPTLDPTTSTTTAAADESTTSTLPTTESTVVQETESRNSSVMAGEPSPTDAPSTTALSDAAPAEDEPVTALALAGPPEYEITGFWISPPATIGRGNPVVAEWHVNVNDSGDPPGNDPIDDVTATFTVDKAIFDAIPDICLTTGVDPVSTISADGMTLTCNFGTMDAGSAIAVQTPVVVTGLTGEQVVADGTNLDGETVTLPPIPIVNTFAMDIHYGQNASHYAWNADYTAVDMNFEWSLRLGKGSDPGPDSITYLLNVAASTGADVQVDAHPYTGEVGCTNFAFGATLEHPYSEHPGLPRNHPQVTNFVDSCTLIETATPGVFELTLTGIDYSLVDIPTMDSAGSPLPTDWSYIASGELWFRVVTNAPGSLSLDSNEPTYTSTTNLTSTDLAANNTTSKAYTLPGTWSSAILRGYTGAGGQNWDDTYRLSAGTQYRQNDAAIWSSDIQWASPSAMYGHCQVIDYVHASLASLTDVEFQAYDADGAFWRVVPDGPAYEYYVGTNDLLTPGDGVYDPSSFDCGIEDGGWTTAPSDPSLVKAVRLRYPLSYYQTENAVAFALIVFPTLHDDLPVGTDVWSFGSFLRNDAWLGHQPDYNPPPPAPGSLTATPGARYPSTNSRRDILRIITAVPAIQKAAAQATMTPGLPVEFTLTYSANGAGAIPDEVDGYVIRDVLPVGMTYMADSAEPAFPGQPVVTMEGPNQVLTWTLNDVPTNAPNTLTYDAVADSSVAPGQPLTNVAESSLGGQTSVPARSTVTMSTNGYTTILKMATDEQVQITDDSGTEILPWTVTVSSFDPLPQAFTDTIDILPYNGDERGTSFNGTYTLQPVVVPAGATVYYTTADPTTLSDDPEADSNGAAAGDPTGNTVGWTTIAPDMSTVTAIRVIGPELPSGATFQFQVSLETSGAEPGDVYVNRAQARAERTELVMRTSAPIELYEDTLIKELDSLVRNADGTYTVTFEISNTRAGNGPGYTLSDDLQFGDAITILAPPTAANTAPGDGSITVANGWEAATGILTIANDVPIADGVTHTYTVATNVSIEGGEVTWENTNCALEGNETGTGFLNTATLVVEAVTKTDPACVEVPFVEHTKELSAGPTANGDGTYTVEYTIDVTNTGAGAGTYDLVDDFQFGEAITIEGTPTVVNTVPGPDVIETLGTWDADATTLAVVDDEPIAAATAQQPTVRHTYVVTAVVSVDAATVTFANTDCVMGDEAGTGLFNESTLTVDQHVVNDDACGEISEPLHTKTVSGAPMAIGGGLYEVEYTIDVTNAGAAASAYDLIDDFEFGSSVTIEGTPTVENVLPGGIDTLDTWDPAAATLAVVDDEPIAAGTADEPALHRYVVTVQVSVDAGSVTFANSDCEMGGDESGTGLFNTATMTVNGDPTDRTACPPISEPVHTKAMTAGPTRLDNGNYAVEFTITVTNAGAAASTYDLVDDFQFSNAVTIEGTPTIVTAPDGVVTLGTWDADETTLDIVEDTPIAAGAADAPAVHTYVVAVEVSVDPAEVTLGNSDCELGDDAGTGLFNTATMTVNDEVADADTCDPFPEPETTFDKSVVAASPNGDGTYTITYTLTVGRSGVGVPYTLRDTLRYGAGTTVNSTTITATNPEGLPVNGGWNGADDDLVAADVPIADGMTHVYTVEVNASIDEVAVPAGASDCELGGDESGTGFSNTATLTTGDIELIDDGCERFPVITINKDITSGPSDAGNGRQAVSYTITVTNSGAGDGLYDLTDRLAYGGGITVVGTTIANATPGGIATNAGWNGQSDIGVVAGQALAAGETHTYTATVTVTVANGLTQDQADCTLAIGETGTGLLNTAQVDNNGETAADNACAALSSGGSTPPPTTPRRPGGSLPRTGGDSAPVLQLAALLLLAGTVVVITTRRRRRPITT